MDMILSDKQIRQLSLSISIIDVLNCLKKDYNSYLKFLYKEFKDNKITKVEYEKELMLIERLKSEQREEEKYD